MPQRKIIIKRNIADLVGILNILILKHKTNLDNVSTAGFKVRSYTKMLNIVSKFPTTHIKNVEEMKQHFIRSGVAKPNKIQVITAEFLETGKNQESIDALVRPELKAVMHLTKIYGIGPANAKKLYTGHGIITLTDLCKQFKKTPNILNKKQAIGLKYFDELNIRIPRAEINAYRDILLETCSEVSPNIKMSINGSYRRGLESSGDIDIMITANSDSPGEYNTGELRNKLIKRLQEKQIIIEVLANGGKKFMGISRLTALGFTTARHLDIIDTKPETYAFAQLYFTGSGGFNSSMRSHALTLGYSLNEYTLSHKTTKIPISSALIQSKIHKTSIKTERDIFEFLDLDYVAPEERNNITVSKVLRALGQK